MKTDIIIKQLTKNDLDAALAVWNEIVAAGNAFPQEERMTSAEAAKFFAAQSYVGVAEADGEIVGIYILHPNNVGRCGHIANASYAVRGDMRGRGIGRKLVLDCLEQAKRLGFRILQFNAVVASNAAAMRLYDSLGFVRLGAISDGFRNSSGMYEDIFVYYKKL